MTRIMTTAAAILIVIAALGAVAFVAYGRERTWALLTGPNDQGAYDFARAPRRPTGNDALACTPGLCRSPDMSLPAYDTAPAPLIERLAAHLEATDRLARRVDDGSDPDYARFVTFSPVMRFPDGIDMRAVRLDDGRTGLEIYSRAKLGSKDFGKNRQRVERLMASFGP